MQAPLFSATTPVFFSNIIILFNPGSDEKFKLIAQIGSLAFFIILTIISALRINVSTQVVFWSGVIKWIVLFIMVGSVIYLVSTQTNTNILSVSDTIKISPYLIISTVLTFIYAFAGVEGLAGISTEVETKNFRKILLILFGVIVAIYITLYILFLFLVPIDSQQSDYVAEIMRASMGIAGLIIFTIGLLFKQITSTIFSMVYYAKTVVPLAEDGFLPKKFAAVGKTGQHTNATIFVTIITIFSMVLFSIIPYYLNLNDQFATILNAGNLVFFVQYLFAIIAIIVLGIKKKNKVKIPRLEIIFYIVVSILIAFIALVVLFPPIVGEEYKSESLTIIISYIGFMALGFIIWTSYLYFLKKKEERIQSW